MGRNQKIFWYLIGFGLVFCGLAADPWALRISPASAANARPVSQENFPAGRPALSPDKPLIAPGPATILAQLPERPTFKTKQPKKAAPEELAPQPAPRIPAVPPPPVKPETSGGIIEARNFGTNRAGLEKAIAAVSKHGGCLYFSAGTWNIAADLTIPARVTIRLNRGGLLEVGSQKGSGTLSSVYDKCAGTISVADGSTKVTGHGTQFGKLRPGQLITCAGQRHEIRQITSNTSLEVFLPFHPQVSRKAFSRPTYTLRGSGTKFNTELEVGDFLYHGKEKHVITSISGPDSLTVSEYPKHPFSGEAYTRSVRVNILGPLEAGLYQIFAGKGVIKFAPGTVTSVHPEWWGAKGNRSDSQATANSLAIEKAIHSMAANKKAVVEFANGSYKINRPIVLLPGSQLNGQGMGLGGTSIILVPHANCHMVKDSPKVHDSPGGMTGIWFNNGSQDSGYDAIHFSHNTKLWQIQRCGFVSYTKHPGGFAIYLNPAAQVWIRENFIMGFHNGIFAYGFDSYYLNNEIAPGGDYAIYMIGEGNVVQGNVLYGDSGCKTGIYTRTSKLTSIIGNRIGPFDNGIIIANGGGIIEGNVIFQNRINGIYSDRYVNNTIISNNKIVSNKKYGIAITNECFNTIIKNNYISNNNGGGSNPQIKIVSHVNPRKDRDEPLVENNVGVDLECDFPILASDQTPSIRESKRWKTANLKPTIITDFAGGCRGKEIIVIFGDGQTTLKFSGATRLRGHGGRDWTPTPGDHLRAVKGDDGYWYCECFDGKQ